MTGTFEDVRSFIQADDRYSAAYKKKIVGRLSSYAKKTNRTLASIPADIQIFEMEFGKGRAQSIPLGYKSKSQANTAASEIRSALRAYLSEGHDNIPNDDRRDIEDNDDWNLIRNYLKYAVANRQELISVDNLIKKCRINRRMPNDISHDFLMECINTSLTQGEYRSYQKAWKLIEQNRDEISKIISLPSDMPFAPLSKSRASCVRKTLPPRLKAQWDSWVQIKKSPMHIGIVKREDIGGVADDTISSYEEALTYYYTCLIELGHLTSEDDPYIAEIYKEKFIANIIEKEANGLFPWNKLAVSSLYSNIVRTLQIMSELDVDVHQVRDKIKKNKIFKNVRSMSRRNQAWCQRLITDQNRVHALYTLPNSTFKIARELMHDYHQLSRRNQQKAIKAAIAACAFAILLSLPLRLRTLTELKHSGLDANIYAFNKGKDLIVNTTADMIKNGYTHERISLTPKAGGSPKQIVNWFIEEVHPILIAEHILPRLCKPNRLFGGINKHRLRLAISHYAVQNGIDISPHLFRHAIATLLANEPNADFSLIAALLGSDETTVKRNYAFVDQAKLHMQGQNRLAKAQNNILMRYGVK